MSSRSLRHRIAIVFVGLLVLVMGFVLALVHSSSERIVGRETQRELAVGTKVFQRLLEQNQRQLETAAAVLSADFAFREAIATQDQPTVRSVIRNHGQRIHAQVMMVAGTDGRLIATTQRASTAGDPFPFPDLIAAAEAAEAAAKAAEKAKPQVAGAGRATGLRTYWVARMTDRKAALFHYLVARPDAVVGLLQTLADADVREGKRSIPGFEVAEDRRAA